MSLSSVAHETVAICEEGRYRAPSGRVVEIGPLLQRAMEGTRLYRPEDFGTAPTPPRVTPRIEVTREKTGEAARRLLEREGESEVAALNFASAMNPGGGFLGGASAQEEDLSRCSGLYFCLRRAPEYYAANRVTHSLLYSDHLIYSPRVPFFRDEGGALLERPFTPSILTSPAPNSGEAFQRDPDCAPEIRATLFRRAEKILEAAAREGHRTLVLGAWGCGVFRNDPTVVAEAFDGALKRWPAFEHVVFAVWERDAGENFAAFSERFG